MEEMHDYRQYFGMDNAQKFINVYNTCNKFIRICYAWMTVAKDIRHKCQKKYYESKADKNIITLAKRKNKKRSFLTPIRYIESIGNKKFYSLMPTYELETLIEHFVWYKSMYNFASYITDFSFISEYKLFMNKLKPLIQKAKD